MEASPNPIIFEDKDIFKEEKSVDLFTVMKECLNYRQPAWYVRYVKENKEPLKVTVVDPGKESFKEKLARAYQEKAQEDIEIVEELNWIGVQLFERLDKEG